MLNEHNWNCKLCYQLKGWPLTFTSGVVVSWFIISSISFPQKGLGIVRIPGASVLLEVTRELVWSRGNVPLPAVLQGNVVKHDIKDILKWGIE